MPMYRAQLVQMGRVIATTHFEAPTDQAAQKEAAVSADWRKGQWACVARVPERPEPTIASRVTAEDQNTTEPGDHP